MSFPSPMLVTHLKYLGRYCPGWQTGTGHPADDLTARSGSVLCVACTATVESFRAAEAGGQTDA